MSAIVLDGTVRSVVHDIADVGPWILCGLGDPERIHTGALVDDQVTCWRCRTIRAGHDPADPAAPARPQ